MRSPPNVDFFRKKNIRSWRHRSSAMRSWHVPTFVIDEWHFLGYPVEVSKLPSQRNMSHTRNNAGHGRVLVKTHKNHSVMYKMGSIFCFFCAEQRIHNISESGPKFTYTRNSTRVVRGRPLQISGLELGQLKEKLNFLFQPGFKNCCGMNFLVSMLEYNLPREYSRACWTPSIYRIFFTPIDAPTNVQK